jgi:methylmalonyl-CoA mutase
MMSKTKAPSRLAETFPAADLSQWRALAEKALKGQPLSRITRKTRDGIAIAPLYTAEDWDNQDDAAGLPGQAPFVRGPVAARDRWLAWDIRQNFAHPSPAISQREILTDLERGVSSVELIIDPTGHDGIVIATLADLEITLKGVRADWARVALDAGPNGMQAARLLMEWAGAVNCPNDNAGLAFNIDPVGLAHGLPDSLTEAAGFALEVARDWPLSSALRADARPVHEAGGSEAQELGALAALTAELCRAMRDAGLPADALSGQILATLSVGPDYGFEIAKLRAARAILARIFEAFGARPEARVCHLQAVSSARMLTRYDSWGNLLRNSAAAFGAGAGGADSVTILPFTRPLGLPDALARRMGRNTQIILQEESGLGRVADPAGGAWAMERWTDDLAKAGWAVFQNLEAQGGIVSAMKAGAFQNEISTLEQARLQDLARRKVQITGVSDFPWLDEAAPNVVTRPEPKGDLPTRGTAFAPLAPLSIAQPFEALRDAARGKKLRPYNIFLASLGPLAEHTARTGFATNVFAAGGIAALSPEGEITTPDQLAHAFKASGARIACLCGSDARYGQAVPEMARALKREGALQVWLAGKPGEQEADWIGAGVDGFVFLGCDVVAALTRAQAALEGKAHD